MALVPKINVKWKQDGFYFYDTTGRYLLDTNPGGWGAPNIEYSDVDSAELKVTNENSGETKTYSLDYSAVSGTPEEIEFSPYEAGFKDGRFKFTLTIIDSSEVVYTATLCKAFFPDIQCCIDKLVVDVINHQDDDFYLKRVNQITALYDALCMSALCLNITQIDNWLSKLKLICNPCHAT